MTTPNDTATLKHQLGGLLTTAQQTHNEALRDLERLRIVQEANDGVVIGMLREIAFTQEANAHEAVSIMQKIAFRYGKLPVIPLTHADPAAPGVLRHVGDMPPACGGLQPVVQSHSRPAVEGETEHDPLPRVLQSRPAWPPQQPPRLNANGGVH